MSYIFEKHHVEKIEIEKVNRNFMKYKHFSAVRKDKGKCGICNYLFQSEDNTSLAFVKDDLNILICDTCADKVIDGGANSIQVFNNWEYL